MMIIGEGKVQNYRIVLSFFNLSVPQGILSTEEVSLSPHAKILRQTCCLSFPCAEAQETKHHNNNYAHLVLRQQELILGCI